MNGYKFKEQIERVINIAREKYPSITNDMLYANGSIYYMNGNDGTDFDWNYNNRLCEFYVFHKNEMGFIKVCVNRNNSINVYIYEDGGIESTYKFKEELKELESEDFAIIMNRIADKENLWDQPIDKLDWNIDMTKMW